ncbi:aldo/keto reductase [Planctomycetales bacterium ZRK34]|nr:aldo/keto reductase [Planctomycetales bacterium ZRK34]
MEQRRLGKHGPSVSVIGFGAFKIGRNQKIKYARPYDLPSDDEVASLLGGALDLGVNYIDTAPAYGISEQRIGKAISHRRGEYTLGTKVGEIFEDGESRYDYSTPAVRASVEQSLRRLRTDVLDIVLIHSDGRDLEIMQQTDIVTTLGQLRDAGKIRRIGLSGKTVEGARAALDWADVIMVEYHSEDRSHEPVITEAAERGVGVVVKKALASGRLAPADALRFVLDNPGVCSAVVGTLSLDHLAANVRGC